MAIEVVYCPSPHRQVVCRCDGHRALELTVYESIVLSGILEQCPEIDLQSQPVGIFGKRCALDASVPDGARVEIYRSLHVDAKAARRRRASSQRLLGANK